MKIKELAKSDPEEKKKKRALLRDEIRCCNREDGIVTVEESPFQ